MESIEVNINQQCTVVLYERGVKALSDYYENRYCEPPKKYSIGDEYTAGLWEIMHIFGKYTYMGPIPPFETAIRIKNLT